MNILLKKLLKTASEKYESGSGNVESYKKNKTKDHDEIVIKLKDGRTVRISNNTKLGVRVEPSKGSKINYHGYRIKDTNVVHKVHPNKHQRGGWLESEKVACVRRMLPFLLKKAQSDTKPIDTAFPVAGTYFPDERFRAFFDEAVPYLKQNSITAGKPGIDYDGSLYHPGVYDELPLYTTNSDMGKGIAGRYYSEIQDKKPYIMVKNRKFGNLARTFVHELLHRIHRDGDVSQRKWKGGLSSDDQELLKKVWPFTSKEVQNGNPMHERATTHGEHLFNIYNELWDSMGKKPTPQEFKDFMSTATTEKLKEWYSQRVNGYQEAYYKNWMNKWKKRFPEGGHNIILDPNSKDKFGINQVRKSDWYKLNPKAFEDAMRSAIEAKSPFVHIFPKAIYEDSMYSDELMENFRNALLNVVKNNKSRLGTNSSNIV